MNTDQISQAQQAPTMAKQRWKLALQVVAAFAVLWALAFGVIPYVGYWGVGVVGALTLAAGGFGIYLVRVTRKTSSLMTIMKGATDEEGRRRALHSLGASDSKDAMTQLARAQLLAQESPAEAVKALEAVDIQKASVLVQDDVRANLAMLYLAMNRLKEARKLVDAIKVSRQPRPEAKAMYAAIMAETFARTGAPEEAKKLLDIYKTSDAASADVVPLLLRAQVYAYSALKKRGLVKQAMEALAARDPRLLMAFMQRGVPPEVTSVARAMLARTSAMPKPKMRMSMRG